MIKKQVYEVFLIAYFQPVLTAKKGKGAAHLPEKMLDLPDKRPTLLLGNLLLDLQ